MQSKLFSATAFFAGAVFAAGTEMFGIDATSVNASASVFVSTLPSIGTRANGRLPIELGELRQVGTLDAAAEVWTVKNRLTAAEEPKRRKSCEPRLVFPTSIAVRNGCLGPIREGASHD